VASVGPLKAIDDLPRSGRKPDITEAARTWLADSDEAARVYRAFSAHRSNLMAPINLI
jgi:hypothetical protein